MSSKFISYKILYIYMFNYNKGFRKKKKLITKEKQYAYI